MTAAIEASRFSLEGVVDMHVHTAPDVRPRLLDDFQLASEAAQAGMRAVLIKSHHTLTADRAALAEKHVEGIRVFGGLVLNRAVGGLNPAAVEAALALGAKEIWMPTLSAANHSSHAGAAEPGITILDEDGRLKAEVIEILDLIAARDAILGTGHLCAKEIFALVGAARRARLRSILVTHPELPLVNLPLAAQQELAGPDVFFERCLFSTRSAPEPVPIAAIAGAIRAVGPESTVLATDFGQKENPPPVEGMRAFIAALLEHGVKLQEITVMTQTNPCRLLGLE